MADLSRPHFKGLIAEWVLKMSDRTASRHPTLARSASCPALAPGPHSRPPGDRGGAKLRFTSGTQIEDSLMPQELLASLPHPSPRPARRRRPRLVCRHTARREGLRASHAGSTCYNALSVPSDRGAPARRPAGLLAGPAGGARGQEPQAARGQQSRALQC